MSTAHRNSYLNAGGFAYPLRMDDHCFSFDNVDMMSNRGLVPATSVNPVLLTKDGRFGPGVGIHDAYTNLATNGAFEADTLNGWGLNKSANAQATMTLVDGRNGGKAVLCRATAAESWIVYNQTTFQGHAFNTGLPYALGFWHKAYDGGFFARSVGIMSSSGTNVVLANRSFTPTDVWQFCEIQFTPLLAGSSPQLYVSDGQRLNAGFLMTELMLVQKPYCPPYIQGSQLSASTLEYDISKMFMKDRGSVSFWLRNSRYLREINNPKAENIYPLKLYSGAYGTAYDDAIALSKITGENKFSFRSFNSTSSSARTEDNLYAIDPATAIAEKAWIHVVMQWDKAGLSSGSTKELYVNGALQGGSSTSALPNNRLTRLYVGSWDGTYGRANTEYSDLVVSKRTFTADEVDAIYRSQASVFDPFDYRIIL